MEIDTIRVAPIAEETVLWFEFLLKPELLEKHVTNEIKAVEIMSEFLNIPSENSQQINEVNSPDSDSLNKLESLPLKLGRKHLALKILALKVASYINWNLSTIEKNLSIQKQVQLMSDLCSITSGRLVNLPLSLVHEVPVSSDGNKNALSFALTLYHRWILRAQVLKGSCIKSKPYGVMIQTPEQANGNLDEKFIAGFEPFTATSIEFLNSIIDDPEPFKMLMFESFVPLEESSFSKNDSFNGQKFDKFVIISKTELKTQIYFDLCSYYIFTKKYDLANEMALLCKSNLEKLKLECKKSDLRFCTVTDEDLRGYLLACGIFEQHTPSLFQRFNESLFNNRKNLEAILIEDNYKYEIPLIHRKCLESTVDKTLPEYPKIIALNCIRYILDDTNIITSNLAFFILPEAQKAALFKHCIKFSNEIHAHVSPSESNKIKKFFIEFFIQNPSVEAEIKESKYFGKNEVESIKKDLIEQQHVDLSGLAVQPDWTIPDSKLQKIRVGDVERKLIAATSTKLIRKYLVELAKFNPQNPLWTINRNWYLSPEIRVVVLNVKRGFIQDFSYILLGKINEMVQKKDYTVALALINELRNEVKRAEFASDSVVGKLAKLIEWEKMHIQIMVRMESWTKKNAFPIKDPWITKLNQMVKTISNEMPRLEIIENVVLTLLNINEWESCANFDLKRSSITELCISFAKTMLDIQVDMKNKNQMPRKREFWDLILPIFNSSNQQQSANPKRNQHHRRSSDSPARFSTGGMTVSVLKQFLDKMRDPIVISMHLSMLTKMHNLLKDDSNLELAIDNLHLWPLSISNVNGYNIKSVAEAIMQLLKIGLKLYPSTVAWIRLQGDLEFVNGNNEAAMKYYVQSLVISTEYCSLPIQRPLVDDFLIKKMIKCSSNLGCFLQSAVLCQFMEEIDYSLAFKCLQEKTSNFQDAMDSYYSLIWDTTLLEYIIHLHSKKNEHKRKLQAISYIKQLELNANNNEDVKQRAASIRKIKFVRSIANQFL